MKQEGDDNDNNDGEWPHLAVMTLIDLMMQRKQDNKTCRTLGASNGAKIASKLYAEIDWHVDGSLVSKKWNNLKSRYKSWYQKFNGTNSSGTQGYQ